MVFSRNVSDLVYGAIRLQETELILVGVLTITTVVVYLNTLMGHGRDKTCREIWETVTPSIYSCHRHLTITIYPFKPICS